MKIINIVRENWIKASRIERILVTTALALTAMTVTLGNLDYYNGGRYAPIAMIATIATCAVGYYTSEARRRGYNKVKNHKLAPDGAR